MPTSSSSRPNLDGCSIIIIVVVTFKSCSFDIDEKKIENEKKIEDDEEKIEEAEEKLKRTSLSTIEEKPSTTTIAQTTTRLNCFTVRNRCFLLSPLLFKSSRLIFLSSSFLYSRFIYYTGWLLYVFDFIVRFALHLWLIRHKLVYYKETFSI